MCRCYDGAALRGLPTCVQGACIDVLTHLKDHRQRSSWCWHCQAKIMMPGACTGSFLPLQKLENRSFQVGPWWLKSRIGPEELALQGALSGKNYWTSFSTSLAFPSIDKRTLICSIDQNQQICHPSHGLTCILTSDWRSIQNIFACLLNLFLDVHLKIAVCAFSWIWQW